MSANHENVVEASVDLQTATAAWFAVSLQTFGGPAGQIAVMHREIVDERRWIGEERFLHALSYCTLLPGPEAQQLATYLGWLLNGVLGGLIAGVLFVVPGYLAIMALSIIYTAFGDTRIVAAVFAGVAPAVLAIVVHAVRRISLRALPSRLLLAIALASFVALALFAIPFPAVILGAAAIGLIAERVSASTKPPTERRTNARSARTTRADLRRSAKVAAVCVAAWITPVVLLAIVFGGSSIFVTQARFFGGSALVTFGGAYAVLAYVAQRAVNTYRWLLPGEMITGLAMAETTPGPLIQVVQFVAFLGAYRNPGTLNPWVAAVIAATLVTWVTYVPSFFFVFVGAPYVERLRGNERITAALTAVTASVVGVIANLGFYFALHTLFDLVTLDRAGPFRVSVPSWSTFDALAAATAVFAALLLFRFRWSVLRVLGACALVGGIAQLALR